MAAILTAKNVTKRFGGLVAVNNVDFEIPEKSIVSIIGPNGAGKTTFFNCITGYAKADEGKIVFDGTPIQSQRPDQISRLGISRTYQNIRLFADMTALENILVGQHIFLNSSWISAVLGTSYVRNEEKMALAEAQRLLNFVDLKGKGDLLARNLPYGAQRRLEIARALATKPKLLLLDEPSAGMNPRESEDLTAFIRHLRDELGITILLIEHHMRVVMGISEHITVLDYGQKIAEGTPKEIQNNKQVIEAYLGRGAATEGMDTAHERFSKKVK
ncbi:MAG: putative branched-chain amino acid ABC transporter ATP-binding protein [Chloroflexi bacterium OLB14]|nr:MAG: putative branched-chain amino acid ABC transporter ATP-binding protein [Chloroflexi bacterium OLB14]